MEQQILLLYSELVEFSHNCIKPQSVEYKRESKTFTGIL